MTRWVDLRDERRLYEDDAVLVVDKPAGISVIGERHDADLVDLARRQARSCGPPTASTRSPRAPSCSPRRPTPTPPWPASSTGARWRRPTSSSCGGRACRRGDDRPAALRRAQEPSAGGGTPFEHPHRRRAPLVVRRSCHAFAGKRTYPARTDFVRVAGNDDTTLLVARPVTGRRHQLRVHLAWIGFPIVGDPLFGSTRERPDLPPRVAGGLRRHVERRPARRGGGGTRARLLGAAARRRARAAACARPPSRRLGGGRAQPPVQQPRIAQPPPQLALQPGDRVQVLRGPGVLVGLAA